MKTVIATVCAAVAVAVSLIAAPTADAAYTTRIDYMYWTNSSHLTISYMAADGGFRTFTNRRISYQSRPGEYHWSRTVYADADFVPGSTISTTETEDESWVMCAIAVNGTRKYKQESSGPYAAAWC